MSLATGKVGNIKVRKVFLCHYIKTGSCLSELTIKLAFVKSRSVFLSLGGINVRSLTISESLSPVPKDHMNAPLTQKLQTLSFRVLQLCEKVITF